MKRDIRAVVFVSASLILLSLLLIMIFAGQIAPRSPYTMQSIRSWTEDGRLIFQKAPYPPSKRFPLGSDEFGRDILSRIIHGSRITIPLAFCIVLLRFALAVPLGIRAALGGKIAAGLIHQFSLIFNAIPALLISLIILKLELFQSMDTMASALAFTVVLAGVTWSRTAHIILERSSNILSMQFIRSEIAIGKSPWMITRKNLIPHLLPETLVLFFMEIGSALTLLMQLGIFAVFLGNLKIVRDTTNGVISYFNVSFEPEWASMLGTARNMISTAPWMVVYPALAFFITVLGFNLFAEGLRRFLPGPGQSPSQRVLSSPGNKGKKNPTGIRRRILVGAGTAAVLMLMFLIPNPVPEWRLQSFSERLTTPVLPGTPEALERAQNIREYFREQDLLPVFGDSYQWRQEHPAEYHQGERKLRITLPSAKRRSFTMEPETSSTMLRKFSVQDAGDSGSLSYENIPLLDARSMDLFNFSRQDVDGMEESFLLVDPLIYPERAFDSAIERIAGFPEIKGFLVLKDSRRISSNTAVEAAEYTEILIDRSLIPSSAVLSASAPEGRGTLYLEFTALKGESAPVFLTGRIQGTDPGLEGKAIMITMDYLSASARPELANWQLNLISALSGPFRGSRSYVICLTPGSGQPGFNGLAEYIDQMPVNYSDIELHINLSGMGLSGEEGMGFNRQQAPVTRTYAWSIARLMEEKLQNWSRRGQIPLYSMESRLKTGQYYFPHNPEVNAHFWEHGIASIFLQSNRNFLESEGRELAEIILESLYMNNHPYDEPPGESGS